MSYNPFAAREFYDKLEAYRAKAFRWINSSEVELRTQRRRKVNELVERAYKYFQQLVLAGDLNSGEYREFVLQVRRDFAQLSGVAGLDRARPQLNIGPLEQAYLQHPANINPAAIIQYLEQALQAFL